MPTLCRDLEKPDMKMLPLKENLKNLIRVQNSIESRLGYLRLDKNENILPLPSSLLKKFQKQITSDFVSAYPEAGNLYEKIAKHEKCSPHNIYLSAGSDGAIKSVFEAFIEPGDKVLILSPTYAMFYVYAKMFGAELKEIFYEKDLKLSLENIFSVIQSFRPKLICLANPNSPTGTVIESSDLARIIAIASRIQAVILVDEAYYLFYPQTCSSLIYQYPQLVVTRTFSKAFGLASARLGYALGQAPLIACLQKTRPMYETNAYALRFAEIILDHSNFFMAMIKECVKGKKFIEKELKQLGLKYFKSYANFILIDFGTKDKALAMTQALKKNKILVKAGFEPPLEGCLRFNIGSVKQMDIFLKALKKSI